ncbi:hypothetical protein ACEPAI_4358 [Sanghuangporus weigelae]
MTETTGFIDFVYNGEKFQTWFKVVGSLSSGFRPLVLLHGGPAVPSPYLSPHIELTESYGIPLIFYDQIGGGKSTHLRQKPSEFWTIDLFMDELDNVLRYFGIADDFDLYGHSWGGMLAAEYVATRRPRGLHYLVIASAPASIALWESCMNKRLDRFPKDLAEVIRRNEREGTTDSKEYQDAIQIFYSKHICQLDPWPKDLLDAFSAMEEDPTVYRAMFGTSELNVTGNLRTWSVIKKLRDIRCETLIMNGADDEAQDECMQPFFDEIPKVKWVRFEKSSHMPFYEEKGRYLEILGYFLKHN